MEKQSFETHSEWKRILNFYNHLHIQINLDIIYMATDYSIYKARTGSKLKLTGALFWEKKLDTVDVKA